VTLFKEKFQIWNSTAAPEANRWLSAGFYENGIKDFVFLTHFRWDKVTAVDGRPTAAADLIQLN
jgi:hypothetical protein